MGFFDRFKSNDSNKNVEKRNFAQEWLKLFTNFSNETDNVDELNQLMGEWASTYPKDKNFHLAMLLAQSLQMSKPEIETKFNDIKQNYTSENSQYDEIYEGMIENILRQKF